jgi:hypothetical protein
MMPNFMTSKGKIRKCIVKNTKKRKSKQASMTKQKTELCTRRETCFVCACVRAQEFACSCISL